MSFDPFRQLTSRTLVLARDNIDTDQIIPARFLTTTSREGLGKNAFYDWRYDASGAPKNDSPFDHVDLSERRILIGGANFGCGSSREHAPWSLIDLGFRAVISSEIADIFKSNSLKNGLLPVEVNSEAHAQLLKTPDSQVSIDLETQTVTLPDGTETPFVTEPFARRCLLDGVDPLGHLLNQSDAISSYEAARA
ncbi:MAG: 3-isopropylmalate dehydratase small subunit [Pseudomonadota bacterium]